MTELPTRTAVFSAFLVMPDNDKEIDKRQDGGQEKEGEEPPGGDGGGNQVQKIGGDTSLHVLRGCYGNCLYCVAR